MNLRVLAPVFALSFIYLQGMEASFHKCVRLIRAIFGTANCS